jgi:hypothetical protein
LAQPDLPRIDAFSPTNNLLWTISNRPLFVNLGTTAIRK